MNGRQGLQLAGRSVFIQPRKGKIIMPKYKKPEKTVEYFYGQLTENFQRWEFACRGHDCCGGSAPISPGLVHVMQSIRYYFDLPVHINRGFSCIIHNARLGSKITSDHCLGFAADVDLIPGVKIEAIRDYAISMPFVGSFGMYDTHFHIAVKHCSEDELKQWDNRTPK